MPSGIERAIRNIEEKYDLLKPEEEQTIAPEQQRLRMIEWLDLRPLDKCRHYIEITKSNIQYVEGMIEKSRLGETAYRPEDWFAYLEEQKNDLAERIAMLPRIEEQVHAVEDYLAGRRELDFNGGCLI